MCDSLTIQMYPPLERAVKEINLYGLIVQDAQKFTQNAMMK